LETYFSLFSADVIKMLFSLKVGIWLSLCSTKKQLFKILAIKNLIDWKH